MLQLGLTTSLEVLNAAIGGEASRIPEPHLLATSCNTETFCKASAKHLNFICSSKGTLSHSLHLSYYNSKHKQQKRVIQLIELCLLANQATQRALELQAHSRMHAKEKRCSWPSRPRRFRSSHPAVKTCFLAAQCTSPKRKTYNSQTTTSEIRQNVKLIFFQMDNKSFETSSCGPGRTFR